MDETRKMSKINGFGGQGSAELWTTDLNHKNQHLTIRSHLLVEVVSKSFWQALHLFLDDVEQVLNFLLKGCDKYHDDYRDVAKRIPFSQVLEQVQGVSCKLQHFHLTNTWNIFSFESLE